jgi:superfamily I DNA/RNA helicase
MAQIALSRDFLSAYARLPRKAQRKLDELLSKFRHDSTAAALHVEPIHRARDPLLRSARLGDDYRLILRAPERGDVFIALYADHHDEAYRWAVGKQTAVHPKTGSLQIFDVEEATRAVTLDVPAETPPDAAAAPIREQDAVDLFRAHDDEALFMAGVPRALLPSVRAVATDEDLERLVPHLPPEAGEILTGLAAGLSLDEALEDVLGRTPPAAGAPEPAPVDTTDVTSALEREGTQRQFFLLGDALDLDTALRHPLDAWRVFLHPKQRRIAHARTKGPVRVLGGAGTGKTVVALHRTAFLVREVYPKPDDRVLLTTFTVNLATDLRAQLPKLLAPDDLARVEVTNIDQWASQYLRSQAESFRQVFGDEQRGLMQQVHDVYGVDGFDLDFCLAEWREVIQDQDIRGEEDYVKAVRRYRGVPLSRAQRRTLWPVFREYRQVLDDEKRLEPLDVLRRARLKLEASATAPRYKAVVVDEAQDFSAEALRLVRAIAGPEHPDDLFLVGDAHQRIYGRQVAFSSAGIAIRGRRSQTLRVNYRTTAAISRFAFGALHGVAVDDLDAGQADRRGIVSLRDGYEPVMQTFDSAGDEERAVVTTVKEALSRSVPPEAIAVLARTKSLLVDRFGPALSDAGIDTVHIEHEEPRRAAVRLATLHRVKGLEFPVVIIVGASDEMLPFPSPELRSEDPVVRDQALLRERCLLYVATSRARDELYVYCHGTPSSLLTVLPRTTVERSSVRPASQPPPQQDAREHESEAARTSHPVVTAGASSDPLERSLDSLALPTRMASFVARRELSTVRELAAIAPKDLIAERNLGRTSVAGTRAVLEPLLGMTWERFSAGAEEDSAPPSAGLAPSLAAAGATGNWDTVRHLLSDVQRGVPLSHIDLPARARGYAEREGLATLGELAGRSRADLVSAPNLGRATPKDIALAVATHFARAENDVALFQSGLLELFKAVLQDLEPMERIILSRRSGITGSEATLEELGEIFGVTRERIRQIEAEVCETLARRVGWTEPTRERLLGAVASGAVTVESLAGDSWWAAACAYPAVIEFIASSILSLDLRIVVRDDIAWLSPWPRQHIDSVAAKLRSNVAVIALPAPMAAVDNLVHETAGTLGPALKQALAQELLATLHVERAPDGSERVMGVGGTRRVEILAILRTAPEPMRIEELFTRLGGRTGLPDEVIHFDRGLIGLRQHFPDYEVWRSRLAPEARQLMQRLGPDRQWSTAELLEELRETHDLPSRFNAYWLAALLRDAEGIRYLGRNRVALTESASAESRLYIHEALEKLLTDAGSPVPRTTLLEQIEARLGASPIALTQVFTRPQFVRLAEDRIGLRARDVPGGEPAIREATDLIESVLLRRDLGLSAWQAHLEVQALSPTHETWPRDLVLSLLRSDDRFRLNQSGSVGLATWDNTRVPTRLELFRTALAASDGAVSVEALMARIEAHYGERPTRATVAGIAHQLDAVLDGEWVRSRGEPEGSR